jgi:hypothetical protein
MNKVNSILSASASILAVGILFGCGGGGGGTASTSAPASTSTTFTGTASAGELVTYTVDTTNLTYSYIIDESQYGLTGRTGSGSLVANTDGTYSLSNVPHSKAVILKNGMLVAAIRENFNGVTKTVAVFGVSNPLTTLAAAAATYNYQSYQCPTLSSCTYSPAVTAYGTFQIDANGTWVACSHANYVTNPGACVGGASTGTLVSLGAGKWQVNFNGSTIGTALGYTAANGQNVMMIDLHDPVYFGYGILVGSSQAIISSSDVDGRWIGAEVGVLYGAPAFGYDTITVTGGNSGAVSNYMLNGVSQPDSVSTFTLNSPWDGMVAFTSGSPGIFAGTGMIAHTGSGAAGSLLGLGFKL